MQNPDFPTQFFVFFCLIFSHVIRIALGCTLPVVSPSPPPLPARPPTFFAREFVPRRRQGFSCNGNNFPLLEPKKTRAPVMKVSFYIEEHLHGFSDRKSQN